MTTEIEERPTHVHTCDDCGSQYLCPIEDCNLVDDEDTFMCEDCIAIDYLENPDDEEDYDI